MTKQNKPISERGNIVSEQKKSLPEQKKIRSEQGNTVSKQLWIMIKLELCNIFGLNEFRFSNDKAARRRSIVLLAAWIILIGVLMFCAGGLAYVWAMFGLEKAIPALLIMTASVITFSFGIFKAGSVVFRRNGYDMLCALPVTPVAVVFSRFLRMYVENLAFSLIIMLPGMAVYAWSVKPGAVFYLFGLLGIVVIPFLPLAGAVLVGALITGIASRMKHKSIASAVLSVLAVLGILFFSSKMTALEDNVTLELLRGISDFILGLVGKIYPPAMWLGEAMVRENTAMGIWCAVCSVIVFGAVTVIVSVQFHSISRMLYSTTAKHTYQMEALKSNSVLWALCQKEFKRYVASSIYVTNTIIGPILGVIFAGALFFLEKDLIAGMDIDILIRFLPVRIDLCAMAALLLAGIFCTMTPASVSVSMEGKEWWIAKSLPLATKTILDAKILMNLLLVLPFYLTSELFLILALEPDVFQLLTLILIPAAFILFSSVFGITINLRFPVLNWENDVYVVKQSAAAVLGGMGGFLLAILCAAALFFVPEAYAEVVKILMCAAILIVTAILYRKNNRTKLRQIG